MVLTDHLLDQKLVLKGLEPASGAYFDPTKVCLAGTRLDVLDKVKEWFGQDGPGVFWLHGAAGAGKSTISASVASMFEASLGGCFFCKRDTEILRDAHKIIPTIVHRLASVCPPFGCLVAQVMDKEGDMGRDAVTRQADKLLLGPLKIMKDQGIVVPRFLVVIDALDECTNRGEMGWLIRKLCTMQGDAPWLKCFITSRPDDDISWVFGDVWKQLPQAVQSMDLKKASNTGEDIKAYLDHCLQELAVRKQIPSDSWPSKRERTLLFTRASGLFIWVNTVHKFLLDELDPKASLRDLLEVQRPGENNAEKELYDLYSAVLKHISLGSARNKDLVRKILNIVAATSKQVPQACNGIACLSNESEEQVSAVISVLKSVLYEDTNKDGEVIIRVYHPSFLDYMESKDCNSDVVFPSGELHALLATNCLTQLESQLKFNICNLETSYVPNMDVSDLPERRKNISGILKYASLYWVDNLIKSDFTVENCNGIHSFIQSPKIIFWIELLSLLQKVQEGYKCMKALVVHTSVS